MIPDFPLANHAAAALASLEKSLAAVIDKALVRNPKDRYPDAGKLLAALLKLNRKTLEFIGIWEQWHDANPSAEENLRDHAPLEQLVVLTEFASCL